MLRAVTCFVLRTRVAIRPSVAFSRTFAVKGQVLALQWHAR